MTIKAIVIDFGGVLVRSEDESGRRAWERRLNLKPGELAHLVFDSTVAKAATVGKASERDVWDYVFKTLGLSLEQSIELKRDFWAGDRLDSTLVNHIKDFRSKMRTAILSNAWDNARSAFINDYLFGEAFDEIIISAEVGLKKPDPEIYILATKLLDVTPENMIFIDDFPQNVAAAAAIGIRSILFTSTSQVVQETNKLLEKS
jgi:glucose-1-phosphatase